MKRAALSTMALLLMASLTFAQPPRRGGDDGEGRGPGGPGNFRPPNTVMMIFDGDQDGELSAKEIEAATAALAKLDENKDGKITEDELPRPPRPQFGNRGPGGQGNRGPGGGNGFNFNAEERMTEWDKDKDGFLTKEELPEGFADRMLERTDEDKDGKISKKELEDSYARLRERFGQGRGRGGDNADGGDRPRRPGGDDAGGRPRRPGGDNAQESNDDAPRRPRRPSPDA